VAAEFPQLCEAETEAFGRLLGTPVQRLATIAHGDGVCTTHVTGTTHVTTQPAGQNPGRIGARTGKAGAPAVVVRRGSSVVPGVPGTPGDTSGTNTDITSQSGGLVI
jgi:hypothetical protein